MDPIQKEWDLIRTQCKAEEAQLFWRVTLLIWALLTQSASNRVYTLAPLEVFITISLYSIPIYSCISLNIYKTKH